MTEKKTIAEDILGLGKAFMELLIESAKETNEEIQEGIAALRKEVEAAVHECRKK